MKTPAVVILGGGGHARVLIDCLRLSGVRSLAVLDPSPALRGAKADGVPVLGGDDLLAALGRRRAGFVVGVGGVGDNGPRKRLFEEALAHGLRPVTVIHPTAVVSQAATVGAGTALLPRCVVNAGAVLGVNVVINTGAIVEHDAKVGDHAHVATGAVLSGGVAVGALAHIGSGAVVRQGVSIGDRAVVGSGAAVVGDVPPGATAVGVPARPLASSRRRA